MSTLVKSIGAVAVTITAFSVFAALVVEYLWLEALGYDPVFWTIRTIKIGFFFAAFVPVFLYFWINLYLLNRRLDYTAVVDFLRNQATIGGAPVDTFMRDEGDPPRPMPLLLIGLAAAVAFIFASILYSNWDVLLRFHWSRDFGQVDPLFGRDIGFYLFTLPFLELQQNGLAAATLIGSVLVVVAYAYGGGLTIGWRSGLGATRPVFWHAAANVSEASHHGRGAFRVPSPPPPRRVDLEQQGPHARPGDGQERHLDEAGRAQVARHQEHLETRESP